MKFEEIYLSLPKGGLLGNSDVMTQSDAWNYSAIAIQDGVNYYIWARGVSVQVTAQEMVDIVKNPTLSNGSAAMKVHERIEAMRYLEKIRKKSSGKPS